MRLSARRGIVAYDPPIYQENENANISASYVATYHNLVMGIKEVGGIPENDCQRPETERLGAPKTYPGYSLDWMNPSCFSNTVDVHSHTPPLWPLPSSFGPPVLDLYKGEHHTRG